LAKEAADKAAKQTAVKESAPKVPSDKGSNFSGMQIDDKALNKMDAK
jgi:hypothetical protein